MDKKLCYQSDPVNLQACRVMYQGQLSADEYKDDMMDRIDDLQETLLRSGTIATPPHFIVGMSLIWPVATVVMRHSSNRWLRCQ
jgi:hypothetical protein